MISITVHGELLVRLDELPAKLHEAFGAKFKTVMDELYAKAVGQLSRGKYTSTDEVTHGVETVGSLLIGYIEPLTVKAKVQETGGKSYYVILPSKARLLRFIGSKDGAVVMTSRVFHPPTPAKHYIEYTLRDNMALIEAELNEAISVGLR